MGKLGDVFGDDFEDEYEQKEQQRQERMSKADKEDVMEACWHAVHGDGFDGEEPRFTFDAGEVEYDVLLMNSPENNMDNFIYDLPDSFGASGKSLGMFHLGELFSCSFIEDMADLIVKIEEDEHYIVLGTYQENESDGETYYNVSPVAGIVPIAKAKDYADKVDDQMEGSSIQEQAEEQSSTDDSSDDDFDLDEDGDDSQPSEEDVMSVFKAVRDKKAQILRDVSDGDEEALTKLTKFVNKNTSGGASEEYVADTYEDNIDSIDGRGEDDEEEDDEFDLGDDEDDEMDLEDDSDDTTDEVDETESEESDEDDGEGVEDWF